jgi:hypothetical protein
MNDFTIARVQVLNGHTNAETAYLVPDYPYGYKLRCQIRYWIETAEKGSAKGHQRWVSQTTNPKRPGAPWNNPKASTYSPITVMYLDENSHVHSYGIPFWVTGEVDTRVRAMGIYDDMAEDQRKRYDVLLAFSRKTNANTWAAWDEKVARLAEHIRDTGADPEIVNGMWKGDGQPVYLTDPPAYVTAARALLASGLV